MRFPRAVRLRRLARVAAQRVAPGSLVLLYHRVAERASDPWSLCVSPGNFAEHLEVLRGRVCRLSELVGAKGGGAVPAGRVALTFDDGYADALLAARPLLERHGVPATVFVATGAAQDGCPFWWDELEGCLRPSRLPASLALLVRGTLHHFEVGAGAREPLYFALHRLLGELREDERRQKLHELRAWSGAPAPVAEGDRALTRAEIANLAADGLVEIGAHSVSHPKLPALSPAVQELEVCASRTFLAATIGRRVTSFAYPHGAHDEATRRLLAREGFERACTSAPGVVRRRTDPLRVPRIEVRDVDGEGFERLLHRFGFGGSRQAVR